MHILLFFYRECVFILNVVFAYLHQTNFTIVHKECNKFENQNEIICSIFADQLENPLEEIFIRTDLFDAPVCERKFTYKCLCLIYLYRIK